MTSRDVSHPHLPTSLCVVLVVICLACSCTTFTIPYQEVGPDLEVAEAMEAFALPEVAVDTPESIFEGDRWANRAADLIASAQRSVIATVFLGSWSPQSAIVLDALAAKARQGIPVYLIFDSISNLEYTASSEKMRSLHSLRQDGVHVLEFNPFTGERILMLGGLMLREHRKFLIIDTKVVALGGMNFNYVSLNDSSLPDGQRDSMHVFQSEQLAHLLSQNFVQFWNDNSWDEVQLATLVDDQQRPVVGKGVSRAWVADQFGRNESVKAMFLGLFDAADREITLLPFLPFLDKTMQDSVRRAVGRGVVVKMLVPWDMRVENRLAVQYAALDLIDMGIELYREVEPREGYSYPLLHEKLMVVDDDYVMVGSSNYNYRSMNLSNELSVVVENRSFADMAKSHLEQLFAQSRRITRQEALGWRRLEVLPNYLFTFVGG